MALTTGILGSLYAVGGIATVGVLLKWGSRRFPKWLKRNRPETAEDWVFAPILGLVGLLMAVLVLWFTIAAWPVVTFVAFQERRRSLELRRAQADDDDEALLRQVREQRSPTMGG